MPIIDVRLRLPPLAGGSGACPPAAAAAPRKAPEPASPVIDLGPRIESGRPSEEEDSDENESYVPGGEGRGRLSLAPLARRVKSTLF